MNSRVRCLLSLVILWLAPATFATPAVHVKCAANQDQVWVYDSLNSFGVEARLHCGETVEVISRVAGYVKVRTGSGVEGYIIDEAFAGVPGVPDDKDKSVEPATTRVASSTIASAAAAPPSSGPTGPTKIIAQPIVRSATPAAADTMPAAPAAAAVTSINLQPATPKSAPLADPKPAVESVSARVPDTSTSTFSPTNLPTTQPASSAAEPEEDADTKPQNESADPACRVFFSAYGLTPSQYKWLADNRRKQFSGICPAPDVSQVDYVILFTHDSDSYADAMPVPVHIDHSNGFSDFNPLIAVDTALVPTPQIEKPRDEFVWVFRMKRGNFDPVKFSPRRHPQFTKDAKGSHAAARAIEDAFNFIQQQGASR